MIEDQVPQILESLPERISDIVTPWADRLPDHPALVETSGDLDAAAELMRKQGLAKADKKATRVAAEGVIAIAQAPDGRAAAMVEVNCETDFVAREHDFRAFAQEVAAVALAERPASLAALLTLPLPSGAAAGKVAPASLGALDVIALEICYTTVIARYYRPVDPVVLLGGARTGIVAYLHARGVADPLVPLAPAHADKYAAENAIDRDVALAMIRYGNRVVTTDLVRSTIAGELAALDDPYSVVFPPRAYQQFVGFLDGRPQRVIGS